MLGVHIRYKTPQLPITNLAATSPSAAPAPTQPPCPTPSWPINTSQSLVTDGCKGQQGLARAGRGLAKVRLLWHGLSVCQNAGGWVACGHPLLPPSTPPKSGLWLQVKKPGWRDSVVIPDQSPRIYVFGLLSTPLHLLGKCAVLSHGGGNVQNKHRALMNLASRQLW